MSNSRTKNSLLNMTASMGYQILNLVLSFVSRTVFLQILGVGYLGINGLFNDVLSMLNMAELGFGTAMTYGMYKPLAENDQETLAALTHFYKKVYRIIALTIAAIGVALIPFLPHLINLEREIPHVEGYYLLFLTSNVASYLAVHKTTVLYAGQKNYILLKHGAFWHVAEILTMLSVLLITKNYTLYLVTQVLFVLGKNVYMSHLAENYYPCLNKKVHLPKEKTKGIFKDVTSAFLYKISNVLITGTDNTLISVLVSTEMVGYYSNYQIVIAKIGAIVSTFFSSLIASLGNLIAKEHSEKRYEVFRIMQSLGFVLSTVFASCIFLLEDDFIRVWLGQEYTLDTATLFAITLHFYLAISLMPITTFREAAGLFRKTKFVMLWTAILNIGLSVALGKLMGLSGILFATSLAKLLTHVWYEPKLLFQDYFQKPSMLYCYQMLKGAAVVVLTVAFARLVSFWFVPSDWLGLIAKGVLVASASVLVTILCYCKTEGFQMLYRKIRSMVTKTHSH